jgi:ornithine carbamoyltransferase
MAVDLRKRHFLKLLDFSPQEITYLLQRSADLKKAKKSGAETWHL